MIPNAQFLQGDFSKASVQGDLLEKLHERGVMPGHVDLVTSDMCPNRTGGIEDRYRIADLNTSALHFALKVIRPEGHFLCKVLGTRTLYEELYRTALQWFTVVRHYKPDASREQSDESFMVCCKKLEAKRDVTTHMTGTGEQVVTPKYGLDDWPGALRHGRSGASKRNDAFRR
jgi:23S rRNA U2552 (ribose-2'-O)-methylase RlmE/FtsJ